MCRYYSTNLKAPEVSFREALLKGLAPDGGLYMPSTIPTIGLEELISYKYKEYHEVAASVLSHFLKDEIDDHTLQLLARDAYDFPIPAEKVSGNLHILRLDRGPSASFKDFAARMMARLMDYFLKSCNMHFTILTATSGDTGSAVAHAFKGLENTDVIILFPAGEVSEMQRKQMTTLRGNIRTVSVRGKFDDCQILAKRAFLDPSLKDLMLSSANSINIGRLLPQAVYYIHAWSKLAEKSDEKVVFSVPSGNYGNLMGGILARNMGLPVSRFVIATNRNDEVPGYLRTGIYKIISPSFNCISSAMNVGHPSNLARMIALYGGTMNEKGRIVKAPDLEKMRRDFFGVSVSDEETRQTISECYEKHGVILEPHGAVAWRGLEYFRENAALKPESNELYISLETAHPAKFHEEILRITGLNLSLPTSLAGLNDIKEEYTELDNDYLQLKEFILKH